MCHFKRSRNLYTLCRAEYPTQFHVSPASQPARFLLLLPAPAGINQQNDLFAFLALSIHSLQISKRARPPKPTRAIRHVCTVHSVVVRRCASGRKKSANSGSFVYPREQKSIVLTGQNGRKLPCLKSVPMSPRIKLCLVNQRRIERIVQSLMTTTIFKIPII